MVAFQVAQFAFHVDIQDIILEGIDQGLLPKVWQEQTKIFSARHASGGLEVLQWFI